MWRFAVGQAIGSAHEKLDVGSQDRVFCACLEAQHTLIAVLSDGAGSAKHAANGAQLTVDTVSSILQRGLRAGREDYEQLISEAAQVARRLLLEESAHRGVSVREYACTLIAAIVTPAEGAALQIGDGALVTGSNDASWLCTFWPQKGEYANATSFLTDDDARTKMRVTSLPPGITDMAMLSDGLESLALQYASKTAHQPFFAGAFAPLHRIGSSGECPDLSASLTDFLKSPAVQSRTDDDASLILASCRALDERDA